MLITAQARIDWRISDLFFDPGLGRFPLRDDWFLERIMHTGARNAVAGVGLLLFVFVAMLSSSSAISLIKNVSGKHCPYDLAHYGGTVPFLGLLQRLSQGVEPGKCWPGGHASGGFCLFAFYFAALRLGRGRIAAQCWPGPYCWDWFSAWAGWCRARISFPITSGRR